MTLFEQCVEAAGEAELDDGLPNYAAITRAVLQTLADHSPSIRAQDEMRRILAEAE